MERLSYGKKQVGMREGFLVVSLTWLFAAMVGALPYWLTAEAQFASPVDSYFEAMSGFTTTGATIVTDIEGLPHGLAMWRQLTQWLGGMGIIVLALAVLPRLRVGGRQLLETELPGPEIEEMTLRIRDTAQQLWLLYIALTALMIAVLTRHRLDGPRLHDELLPGGGARVDDVADRRVLDPGPLTRGVRRSVAVGDRLLHGRRRRQLRAHVPRLFPATATRFRP